jgi:hypothetical protein
LLRTPWRNPLIESAFQIGTFDPSVTTRPERLRKLAREGARFTAQHLRALSPLRRRATLVATVLDTITRLSV